MSESKALVTLEQQLARLDEIAATSNVLALVEGGGQFSAALEVADKMNALREALTPEIMQRFMKLQGNALGFRTDQDDKGGYGVEVVRDVMIEATFKGFGLVGNQTNIIGGRFYGTREGFQARMRDLAKRGLMSDLKITAGVPKTVGDGAVVTMAASWKWKGVADSMTVEIPIRVNKFQGADAILGKAERKLLAKIYSRVTNTEVTDGEIGDVDTMKRAETPDGTAPAAGTTQTQAEPLDADTIEKLVKKFGDYEGEVNLYLIDVGWIQKGETYRNLTPKRAKSCLDKPDAVLEQAGVKKAK